MLYYFLSYVLIGLGAVAVTVGILGKFEYRGRLRFDLDGLVRFLLFLVGVGILVGAVVLYSYQAERDRYWNRPPMQTPTGAPSGSVVPSVEQVAARWHEDCTFTGEGCGYEKSAGDRPVNLSSVGGLRHDGVEY